MVLAKQVPFLFFFFFFNLAFLAALQSIFLSIKCIWWKPKEKLCLPLPYYHAAAAAPIMSKYTAANRKKWMFCLFRFTALKKTFSAKQKIWTVYEESKEAEWMRMSVRAFIPWLFATIASELSLGRMCSCFFLLWKQFDRSSWWRTEQWPAAKHPAALKNKLNLYRLQTSQIKRRTKALVAVCKSGVFQQSSSLFGC